MMSNTRQQSSPYHFGQFMARSGGLTEVPYGPGWRQADFIQGYLDELNGTTREDHIMRISRLAREGQERAEAAERVRQAVSEGG